MIRKVIITLVILIGLDICAFTQQANNSLPEPASERTERITALWYDRATISSNLPRPQGREILWYREPARIWEEALPIGNGRLGAMVYYHYILPTRRLMFGLTGGCKFIHLMTWILPMDVI